MTFRETTSHIVKSNEWRKPQSTSVFLPLKSAKISYIVLVWFIASHAAVKAHILVRLLEKNGFPLNCINRQIQHFLAKKQSKPRTDKKDDTKRIFMKLPYIKEMNGHIPKEINGFLKKLDFKVTFILINKTFNLKRLFTFKERQNKLHRSSVVYRITCSCKSTYIGQTSRNLITRLKNHDPNSPNRQDTDVYKHLTDNPDHKIDFDKTEIMAQTNHWRKLLITETLLVKNTIPT